MKKAGIGAALIILMMSVQVFAQGVPSPPPPVQQRPPQVQQPAAAAPEAAPKGEAGNRPAETPAAGPSGSVTPEQIRSFFSKPKEENYIILNFDNADLKDVINTVGSITNENFILSPGLDARVTIHSTKKIPVSEVMNVFESVLEVNGMSVVRSGEFLKIVAGSTAKQKPTEVRIDQDAATVPDVDRPVTQIIPVEYVPVTEVSTILTPLLSQFGSLIPNPRNNLLIVNDLSSSIVRLLKVLKEIDVNAFQNTRMTFFKPKYSDVLSLSNELTEVLNALNLTREGIALVPIERINSLIIFSGSPSLLEAVEGWIRKLDEEVMTGQNVFVYPVQNVEAGKIADILKTLYESSNGSSSKVTPQTTAAAKPGAKRPPSPVRRSGTSSQPGGNSRVEIITFEPTNSLVILAPPGIYREIVKNIKQLDIYPREVLIEAIIAKVDITDSDQYGVRWSVLHDIAINGVVNTALQGNTFSGDGVFLPSKDAPTFNAPPTGGISYLLFKPDKISALIYALASKSKVNILQSPRLLVRDQEEASIEVGSEIPTATSTTATTTAETLTQNIEYKTVGIKLKIKPTINDEKTVVLDLEQEVSAKGGDQQVGQSGNTFPVFTTTRTKTSIIVPHEQGIIIGGIMEETRSKNYSGIPLLSDLPLLGPIFRYNEKDGTKTELVILITPHVITSKSEGDVLTSQFLGKLNEIRKFLDKDSVTGNESMPGTK